MTREKERERDGGRERERERVGGVDYWRKIVEMFCGQTNKNRTKKYLNRLIRSRWSFLRNGLYHRIDQTN